MTRDADFPRLGRTTVRTELQLLGQIIPSKPVMPLTRLGSVLNHTLLVRRPSMSVILTVADLNQPSLLGSSPTSVKRSPGARTGSSPAIFFGLTDGRPSSAQSRNLSRLSAGTTTASPTTSLLCLRSIRMMAALNGSRTCHTTVGLTWHSPLLPRIKPAPLHRTTSSPRSD
jgi:hypothetical protein